MAKARADNRTESLYASDLKSISREGGEPSGTPPEVLEAFRKKLGLTQKQLADALRIARSNYSMIVNGRRRITPAIAMRLSIVLGTSAQMWLNLQNDVDLEEAKRSPQTSALRKELKPLVKARD